MQLMFPFSSQTRDNSGVLQSSSISSSSVPKPWPLLFMQSEYLRYSEAEAVRAALSFLHPGTDDKSVETVDSVHEKYSTWRENQNTSMEFEKEEKEEQEQSMLLMSETTSADIQKFFRDRNSALFYVLRSAEATLAHVVVSPKLTALDWW